jgi:hypothetical protein
MRFLACVFLALGCGQAAADGMVGTLAVARRTPVLGWELELGYRLMAGPVALNLMPVGGILYQGDTASRFRSEQRGNSGYACVDTQSGNTTYAGFCAGRLSYAGSVSADLHVGLGLHLGGGLRLGRENDGFGLLRLEGDRGVGLQLRVGPNYWSLGGSYKY